MNPKRPNQSQWFNPMASHNEPPPTVERENSPARKKFNRLVFQLMSKHKDAVDYYPGKRAQQSVNFLNFQLSTQEIVDPADFWRVTSAVFGLHNKVADSTPVEIEEFLACYKNIHLLHYVDFEIQESAYYYLDHCGVVRREDREWKMSRDRETTSEREAIDPIVSAQEIDDLAAMLGSPNIFLIG